MEITDPPTCSTCGQPAETRCTGCIEGLDEQGKPTAVVYCSKTCQKVAWPTHKPDCKISNHRKQLYRAGSLVQKAFHEFRQAAFDVPVLKVEKVQGKLHARIAMSVPGRILFNFPADQFIKEEDKNAMLCWRTCDDAVGRMWPLVSMTLSGLRASIVELVLSLEDEQERVVMREPNGLLCPYISTSHRIFQVKLQDGSLYALDSSCAQYGLTPPVMPWAEYKAATSCRVKESHPPGTQWDNEMQKAADYKDPHNLGTHFVECIATQRLVGDYMHDAIARWTKANGVVWPDLLQSKAASYTIRAASLLSAVVPALHGFVQFLQKRGDVGRQALRQFFADGEINIEGSPKSMLAGVEARVNDEGREAELAMVKEVIISMGIMSVEQRQKLDALTWKELDEMPAPR